MRFTATLLLTSAYAALADATKTVPEATQAVLEAENTVIIDFSDALKETERYGFIGKAREVFEGLQEETFSVASTRRSLQDSSASSDEESDSSDDERRL